MVREQLHQVDMNRLALACVTVVKLADVVIVDAVETRKQFFVDGVELHVAVVHEMCMMDVVVGGGHELVDEKSDDDT